MKEWPYNLLEAVCPEQDYEGSEKDLIPSVMYALYSLNETQRNVIRFRYESNYSLNEIAERLGKTCSYMHTSHNKAIVKLRSSKLFNVLFYGVQGVAARQLKELSEKHRTEIPIEQLELSVKAYNALKRAGIHTIEKLIALHPAYFASLQGLFVEQRQEIISALRLRGYEVTDLEKWERLPRVAVKDAERVPLESLDFSVRVYNALKRRGVHSLKDLLDMDAATFMSVRHLGREGRREVISTLEANDFDTSNLIEG